MDRVEPNIQMSSELFGLWKQIKDEILFDHLQSKIYQQLIVEETH